MRFRGTLTVFVLILGSTVAASAAQKQDATSVAIFAGGCFWCMEPPYDKLDGVLSTTSGYTGGSQVNPTYKQVSSGMTSHREGGSHRVRPQARQLRAPA